MTDSPLHKEAAAIAERYARRGNAGRYSMTRPEVLLATQECQRGVIRALARVSMRLGLPLEELRVLDVGCGYGGHILDFIRFGCLPANICGIELLPERAQFARKRVPAGVAIIGDDATGAVIPPGSFHVVFQSVVFSSLLDDDYQQKLADQMWAWLAPGGSIVWYDFAYDNPRNPDVRGVGRRRVRELFRHGRSEFRRITLAPPISRFVCRIHPAFYPILNAVPLLRSHLLCTVSK